VRQATPSAPPPTGKSSAAASTSAIAARPSSTDCVVVVDATASMPPPSYLLNCRVGLPPVQAVALTLALLPRRGGPPTIDRRTYVWWRHRRLQPPHWRRSGGGGGSVQRPRPCKCGRPPRLRRWSPQPTSPPRGTAVATSSTAVSPAPYSNVTCNTPPPCALRTTW